MFSSKSWTAEPLKKLSTVNGCVADYIDLWLRLVVGRGLRYTFFPSMNSLSGVSAFFRTAPLTYFSFLQCFLVQRRDTLVLGRPDW